MVADTLVYHPSVAHYLKFVATTVGRDKLLRTLQYFSRFYAWYLLRTNGTPTAAIAADSKSLDPVIKYCAVGRQLGYAGYLTFDAFTVLDAAGIRKSPSTKRIQKEAYRFWLMGLLFSTASGMYSLYNLRQQSAKIDKKDGESVVTSKRIEKERAAINMQLLSDLCDLTIPSSAIGLANFDDGIVGLAGTLSSLIGVYGTWKKTA
ncbi:peroxisomal biogenesis factor 11 [Botrytis cinerea]